MAIISVLTGMADHVHVIEQRPDAKDVLIDPACPMAPPDEIAKWDASECEAMSVIMMMASKLHRDVILKHCTARKPVFKLFTFICDAHQSCDASHRHQAWIEFFSLRKAPNETYSAYMTHKEGLGARIEHITPEDQSRVEHFAELKLFSILFGLPYKDTVRQTLVTQGNLTLQQAREAMVHVDTGAKLHMASSELVNAASTVCCWRCDSPGHLAPACPHTGAIKDIIAKCNTAHKERKKKFKTLSSSSAATADTNTASDPLAPESASVAACFLTTAGPVSNKWLCDTGASCSMSSN